MKRAQEEKTNLIDATSNETEHLSVPGLQESVLCMTNLAFHGVILNGFLCLGRHTKTQLPEIFGMPKL